MTASEAKDPGKVLPRAINTVPIRILLFYVLTLFVLMAIYPWNSIGQNGSPFVEIFSSLGINSAANILNLVVITAAISAINSDIYGAGRMMYGLAQEGLAPKSFSRLTRNGVPYMTILVMAITLLCGVVLNYLIPKTCSWLLHRSPLCNRLGVANDSGITSGYAPLNEQSTSRSAGIPRAIWPLAPILTILFMAFIIAVLGYFPATRIAMYVGLAWVALMTLAWWIWLRKAPSCVIQERAKSSEMPS